MKKIINFTLLMVLSFLLVGCGNNKINNKNDNDNDNKIILTDIEKILVDKIDNADFFDPTSVKFLEGFVTFDPTKEETVPHTVENLMTYYIKIQANNKAGGTLTKCYNLSIYDNFKKLTEYDLTECDYSIWKDNLRVDSLDIKKLNEYYKQHWEELGID